ncbi:hypothetical protein L218DRAFT_259951 [Marasmius fiardii PR-910]|nr:hypothetical protein L218DRAFT_259951 [Marasmius fiardii PR-910]
MRHVRTSKSASMLRFGSLGLWVYCALDLEPSLFALWRIKASLFPTLFVIWNFSNKRGFGLCAFFTRDPSIIICHTEVGKFLLLLRTSFDAMTRLMLSDPVERNGSSGISIFTHMISFPTFTLFSIIRSGRFAGELCPMIKK